MIAIVGRPNVGKSSLFNRLLRRRRAIVAREPGITRDRLTVPLAWRGQPLWLVDTGGVTLRPRTSLAAAIQRQVTCAITQADLLLFVCDVASGLAPLDAHVADLLRKAGKPVLVVANKADTAQLAQRAVDFHALGFGPPIAVSSIHGRGIGDLLDAVLERCPRSASPTPHDEASALTIAVVGRPNVGKSSVVNSWVGEDRVTVDAIPGTTRDAVDVLMARSREPGGASGAASACGSRAYRLIDTAGVRARPKLKTLVDVVSVKQSREAVERADGCVMLVDASAGMLADDRTLLGTIVNAGCPCVVAFNKWDLVEAGDPDAYAQAFWQRAPFAAFVPVIATSAKTGYHLEECFALAAEVADRGRQPLKPRALAAALRELREAPQCPARLRRVCVVRVRQAIQRPLTIALTIRGTPTLRRSDLLFVERVVRGHAPVEGVPVRVVVHRG